MKTDQSYACIRLWSLQFFAHPPPCFGEGKASTYRYPGEAAGGAFGSLTLGPLAPEPKEPEVSPRRCWEGASRTGPSHSFHTQKWEGRLSGNYLANHIDVGVERVMGETGGSYRNWQPARQS